jgi:xanthine dehydrogenase accessory factor
MKRAVLADVLFARLSGTPLALVTNLQSGAQALVLPGDCKGDLALDAETVAAARLAIAADRHQTLDTADGPAFVQVFNPPMRLIIVGAVHIAEALARIAALAGYGVTIVDPRRAFASRRPFEGVAISEDWPDEALENLAPDHRTAIVTLTHDPKLDDPALAVALRSPVFYIGSLGSRKTHAARLERLRRRGFGEAELARIHGPVGLAIGALSPAEIALSIMAEITQLRRQRETQRQAAKARNH